MTVLESLKSTVCTAADAIQSVTQAVIEKNRTSAMLNRLRFIMKNESELMNRAYIALGKQCYEKEKTGVSVSGESQEKLIAVVDASKARLAKARECYKKIVDSSVDAFGAKAAADAEKSPVVDVVDITVACSNENEYSTSPFSANRNASEDDSEEA